jgi:vitamin B12 transporter
VLLFLKKKYHLTLAALTLALGAADAQQHHDTLPDVTIIATRFDQTGYAVWRADTLPTTSTRTLAERLLMADPVAIRANAPGTLATASARGLGASRTAIFWEGLNLQSPQNGVTDLSLIPVWPDDRIEVRYGGQSAAQSSGSMGGSILIEQKPAERVGWSGSAQTEVGSFGRVGATLGTAWSGPRLRSEVRYAGLRARNDFSFRNTALIGAPEVRQANNAQRRSDFQQFNQLKINKITTLRTALWQQSARREIPPAMTGGSTDTEQTDRNVRAVATLEVVPSSRSVWRLRSAWADERIAFRLGSDTDSSRAQTALLTAEWSYHPSSRWAIRAAANGTYQRGQADGYADTTRWQTQRRPGTWIMVERTQQRLRLTAIVRQEWLDNRRVPLVWSLGGQWRAWSDWGLRWHVSRNFNLPTLNDRYWRAWGKADLRPESGYSADAGIFFQKKVTPRSMVLVEATAYALHVSDWILWQPGSDGIFRPDNLRQVRSLGGECRLRWEQAVGRSIRVGAEGRYQHIRATNVAVYDGSESTLGRDLVYTPRHVSSSSFFLKNNSFSMSYLHSWTGRRFVSADNQARVAGFDVATWLLSRRLGRYFTADIRIENCWNKSYQILAFRPMPGRSWSMGVQVRW